MAKYIYFFGGGRAEGDASPKMTELLGNKGAQLHEMSKLGLPVPPGFTISTEVCEYYFTHKGSLPPTLMAEVRKNIKKLEKKACVKFGVSETDPLLVSARSGAAVSMPGMMETILNLGLTDKNVSSYIARHNAKESSIKFILDSQRRLYEMFGENVFGIRKEEFRQLFDGLKKEVEVEEDTKLSSAHLRMLISRYKALYRKHKKSLPQDPYEQLEDAIRAVEESSMGQKAINYRKAENLPEKVYTGVNIQMMVYGNENIEDCGTGVGFTRDPATGEKDIAHPYGEFLLGGQGEDVVSGRRNVFPISEMKRHVPGAYRDLVKVCQILEKKTKRIQDYEFTVWQGKLYMLQTRDAKLTGRASIRASIDMAREGLIDEKEAIARITPANLEQLLHKTIDYNALAKNGINLADIIVNPGKFGVPASPGAGVGRACFDMETALRSHSRGEKVVLCRLETSPSDYAGMIISEALVTARGGKTSHAAIVARNKGIPCAVGTAIDIREEKKLISYKNSKGEKIIIRQGDWISVDGSTGNVFNYKAPLSEPNPDDSDLQALLRLIIPQAKMRVYANANDAEEAARALQFKAEGIGLARTEYMFLEDKIAGENRSLTIQAWILARDKEKKKKALDKLEKMQKEDFLEMYKVMKDKPIIARFLDYPLHELLGNAKANLEELSRLTGLEKEELVKQIDSFREVNPMLGHRSVRLGITHPEIYQMQARAIFKAAREFAKTSKKKYITPYIEIPLVSQAKEVENIAQIVDRVAAKLGFKRGGESRGRDWRYRMGIMYELAGASFEADNLAKVSDFGSFGTNDLTQTTLGWSREDGATTFGPKYLEAGIIKEDPFQRIDEEGPVKKAMALAVIQARNQKPDYEFGICGEHAADSDSLEVCYGLGLANVSPGPNQVPIAWLKSAQLSLTREHGKMLKEYAKELSKDLD